MADAAENTGESYATAQPWGADSPATPAESGRTGNADPAEALAHMLSELQCSRLHVYREKPLYASGFLGTLDLQPGEALDFDAISNEWGGGTLRFRPTKESGHFAPGSKTYKFSGPPKYQGRIVRPDGQLSERPVNSAVPPVQGAQQQASMVRAAIPKSNDPAVNALADIVTQLLATMAAGQGGGGAPDPATQLGAYAKSLAEAQKLLNPQAPADDDDDDDGGGFDPSMMMMMMMMNQQGGAPGGPNPMMMLLPQLMRGGGGGGALGGMDPMMMMMMMNQGGGAPPGFPPQQPTPQGYPPGAMNWHQQQAPQWPGQQPPQQPQPQQQANPMNPAMMAWLMQQQQQQQRKQQQPPAQPQQPPAQAWTPPSEPVDPDDPPATAPTPVDDADPYKF